MSETLEQMETAADRIRRELDRTVAELERRGHRAVDVRLQLREHRGIAWGSAVAAALALGGVVTWVVFRLRSRDERRRRERWQGLRRAWHQPQRIAKKRPNVAADVGAKVLVTAAGVITAQLAKRAAKRLAPATPTATP